MKRNARRAVLIAVLAAGAGFVQAAPASANQVCAHAWAGSLVVGDCVGVGVGTRQCAGNSVLGVGGQVCAPVPL